MKRQRKVPGIVAFTVFVMLILVSGYALSVSGYTDNPFTQIALMSGQAGDSEGRFGQRLPAATDSTASSALADEDTGDIAITDVSGASGQFQLPPVSALDDTTTSAEVRQNADAFGGERPDENAIDWSSIGDVLYDLWYICATVAVFIVVQQIFKFVLRQFQALFAPRGSGTIEGAKLMSTQETRQHLKFGRSARNLGISALLAVTIGGYALHERTAVAADALQPIQWSQIAVTAEATAGATAEATEPTGQYRDGEYTGQSVRTGQHWGNTQITAIITGGKLTDFKVNDYPHSTGRSLRISQVALPDLMQEAIQVQSASVDIISGATQTTEAFMESLQSALEQASTAVTPSPTPTLTPTGSSV